MSHVYLPKTPSSLECFVRAHRYCLHGGFNQLYFLTTIMSTNYYIILTIIWPIRLSTNYNIILTINSQLYFQQLYFRTIVSPTIRSTKPLNVKTLVIQITCKTKETEHIIQITFNKTLECQKRHWISPPLAWYVLVFVFKRKRHTTTNNNTHNNNNNNNDNTKGTHKQ